MLGEMRLLLCFLIKLPLVLLLPVMKMSQHARAAGVVVCNGICLVKPIHWFLEVAVFSLQLFMIVLLAAAAAVEVKRNKTHCKSIHVNTK